MSDRKRGMYAFGSASDKSKFSRLQIFYVIANHAEFCSFPITAHLTSADFGLDASRRSMVGPPDSAHRKQRTLHSTGSPRETHSADITKVLELSITDGAKRDLTGSASSRPLMNSIQPQPALKRRNLLRAFLMNMPLMSPAEKRCWSRDSFPSDNTPCASL